ncbi:MAG: oligosaccharide flippase family protein [Opitutaceae bacterium]
MPSAAPQRRSVISSFLFQGCATFSTYAVSLALIPLVLKNAGASVYGSFILWSSVINLGLTLLTLGAGFKARRTLPSLHLPTDQQKVFGYSASFQVLTYAFAALVLIIMGRAVQDMLFPGHDRINATTIIAVVASVYLNNLSDDYFRYTHRIRIISIVSILRAAGYPVLVILHVFLGGTLNVDSLLLCQAASYGGFSLWLWLKIAHEFPIHFGLSNIRYHLEDIRYGFPLIAAVLFESLLTVSDRYILSSYLSTTAVGIYAPAAALGSTMLIFPKICSSILSPAMASAVDVGNQPQAERLLQKTLNIFLVLGLPFIAGAAFLAEPLLSLLATPEIGFAGRWVVPLTAVASLFYGWNYIIFNALFVKMQTGLWLRANALAASLSITLNLVLLYYFRMLEVASLTSIVSYACALVFLHRSHAKSWPVRLDLSCLLRIFVGVAVMSAFLASGRFVLDSSCSMFLVVALLVPGGMLVYAGCIVATGIFDADDLEILRKGLQK